MEFLKSLFDIFVEFFIDFTIDCFVVLSLFQMVS